jgi:hypothetical protein
MGNTHTLGLKHSPESRDKMSASRMGKPWSALRRARYQERMAA